MFTGSFDARGTNYRFTFAPTAATVKDGKLELSGRFSVLQPRGAARTLNNVSATLLATQGGIGASPTRRQLLTGTAGDSNVSSTDQKQEQAKAPESAQQTPEPGRLTKQPETNQQAAEPMRAAAETVTMTQATGDSSFVGVMYFRLQPLDGGALGVPVDLSSVQLNTRLGPVDDVARDLQFLYSDLIAAVYSAQPNERTGAMYVQELNRVLQGGSTASTHSPYVESQEVAVLSSHDHIHFQLLEATE